MKCNKTASDIDIFTNLADVENVSVLEGYLAQFPQVIMDTTHIVHGKMYARTILIPAGTVLTGALTALDNICIMCGDITVTTDDGPQRLTGFNVISANSGAKRAGIAHADTWWTTIIHTNSTNIGDAEDEMTCESSLLQDRIKFQLEGEG